MDGHLIAFVALLGVAMICKLRTSRGRQTMVEVFGRLFHGSCSGFTSPLQGNKVMMRIGGCSGELAPGELVVVDRTFDYRASPRSCAAVCNSDGLLCIIRNDACALWFCHISSDIDCLKWGRLGLLMAIECLLVWRHLMAVEDNVVWRFPMLQAPLTSSKLVSSQRTHINSPTVAAGLKTPRWTILSFNLQIAQNPGENHGKTHPKSHGLSSLPPWKNCHKLRVNPPFSGTKAVWWLIHSSLLLHVYCLRQPVLITKKSEDFPILWFDISAKLNWWYLGFRWDLLAKMMIIGDWGLIGDNWW